MHLDALRSRRRQTGGFATPAQLSYLRTVSRQSPRVSEFGTPEEAAAYEKWLAEKVAASLADGRPGAAHDEAMARGRKIIERSRRRKAC